MDTLSCPACGAANRPEARFCWSCGAAQAKACSQCHTPNRLSAQFCIRWGAWLGAAPTVQNAAGGMVAKAVPAEPSIALPSASLRLLEANTYPGFGRSGEKPAGEPIRRFGRTDTAFHIRLQLANLEPMRQHSHRLFVQFFRPNGRLHHSRERPELVVASTGQMQIEAAIFGLRLSGTEAANYPGMWRAVLYLDEEKLTEIPFEIEE